MSDYRMDADPMFRANDDFMVISGDSGRYSRTRKEIMSRTPSSSSDVDAYRYEESLKNELYNLENKLSDEEFMDFDRNRNSIGNISEQIYYLRLTRGQRAEYLTLKNIESSIREKTSLNLHDNRSLFGRAPSSQERFLQSGYHPAQKQLIETAAYGKTDDVVVGMTMDQVVKNWGTPERRDVAGDEKYRNERWAFRKKGVTKYVYFESGVVQGWSEN